ncbi:MAG: hypothetical protein AB1641_06780 [Thermodesulfobacteriota bacterium]
MSNDTIRANTDQLRGQILKLIGQEEKHLRLTIYVKVILLAFVIIYLGWAYSNVSILDADLLVLSAKEKIVDILPQAKDKMKERLAQMAPGIINQVGDGILESIPKLSQSLEDQIKKTLLSYADPVEKDISGWLSEFVTETRAITEEMFPGRSSYEQITLMRTYILEDLSEALKGVSYEIGDSVRDVGFTEQLRHLVRGKNLSAQEKLHRDIIALWYVIVERKISDLDFVSVPIISPPPE